MTHVVATASGFAADAAAGFVDAYGDLVAAVPGGVVRATATPEGKVAVVIGGGSGHYPLFAGYVGAGLADGAVLGDIFASPSARQVADVGRSASRGGGVLLTFGNYAGDVLNFTAGADVLRAGGIETRIVAVTDDVASGSPDEHRKRRGVTGNVVVFKVAGAAAEAGYDLDRVVRVATLTNDRTRSFGVAFSGCTLPGSATPLFELKPGTMGVGLGLHGEPGISEGPIVPAPELARLLVERLLEEAPSGGGSRVAAILNGLGSTKHEELFVLWRFVAPMLRDAGLVLVAPLVGELATSLDMAGCSLTLTWLDDELERLWLAPSDAPAFRRGSVAAGSPALRVAVTVGPAGAMGPAGEPARQPAGPSAGEASREGAALLVRCLDAARADVSAREMELGDLDAVAGDGDHGRGMVRGLGAACEAATASAAAGAGAATTLLAAAEAWADRAGGTSGALWGVALRAWSAAFADDRAVSAMRAVVGARSAVDAVIAAGGARPGDKTMLDAMIPFVAALDAAVLAGSPSAAAWADAAAVAVEAAQATADLVPRIGRARPLAERSVGHADPGAVSFAICVSAVARVLADEP